MKFLREFGDIHHIPMAGDSAGCKSLGLEHRIYRLVAGHREHDMRKDKRRKYSITTSHAGGRTAS
ncbi:hypothetical protein CSUB_C1186 [Candidatus Caldarchaeum subterraneum]|uniref:Uncharacterized protein n=1 Tax=Caldiarchaeum subterraneum TaxID=311458 RepID=E6N7J4_CALS0|nr:hypothetical protein HGMM_F53A03C19 [Candidatus Caldarchaeum subterraneum]BAJ51038.1 hypothetical protein CSUB_C1186 [Candidatus Caldarchaeum subterraneum]